MSKPKTNHLGSLLTKGAIGLIGSPVFAMEIYVLVVVRDQPLKV